MPLGERSLADVAIHWPAPNYKNPHTRDPVEIYAINSTFLFVATLCVTTRLYTRICIRNWFGLDDVFIVLALLAACGVYSCVVLGVHDDGWDRHIYDVPFNKFKASGKTLFASRILWSVASTSARFSVCCLFYRLLDHTGLRKYRWVLHVNSVFMALLFLSQEGTTILECVPIKAVWTFPVIENSRCLNNEFSLLIQASLNTFSEFTVACFPIPIVMSLNMRKSQRFAVIGLLSLGFLVVICGSLRTYYLWLIYKDYDFTWWAVPHWIVSEVEIDTSMICACVPVLKPLLTRLLAGGPKAMGKPNINETGHLSSDGNSRSRSLFAEKLTKDSELYDEFGTLTVFQTIDLEGIANDGFGYTVTITGGAEKEQRKRNKLVKKPSKAQMQAQMQVQMDSDCESESAINLPHSEFPTSRSPMLVPPILLPPKARSRSESRGTLRINHNGAWDLGERRSLEIMEKREFELRESWDDGKARNWDVRANYAPMGRRDVLDQVAQTAEDVDEKSPVEYESTTEDDNTPRNRMSLQSLPHRPLKMDEFGCRVVDQNDHVVPPSRTPSNIDLLWKNSAQSRNNSTLALRNNPTTINVSMRTSSQKQSTVPRVLHATRMNTPSPPPGPPRGVSPVVSPNNSSQPWATQPSGFQLIQPNNLSDEALTAFSNQNSRLRTSRPDTLDLAIASAWSRPGSRMDIHDNGSSMQVEDGSRESLVLKLDPIADDEVDVGVGEEEEEEEDFDLPIERPSTETVRPVIRTLSSLNSPGIGRKPSLSRPGSRNTSRPGSRSGLRLGSHSGSALGSTPGSLVRHPGSILGQPLSPLTRQSGDNFRKPGVAEARYGRGLKPVIGTRPGTATSSGIIPISWVGTRPGTAGV